MTSTQEIQNKYKKDAKQTTVPILKEEEYNKLSDEEKLNYIQYNPSATDKGVAAAVAQANAICEMLSQYGPMFEKMKTLPNPLPGEQLEKIVQSVEKMTSLLDPIEKLASVPIIGQLVKPLVNLINAIFQVLGFLFWLSFMLSTGKDVFTDTYIQTVEQVDWEGLKNQVKDMKNMETTASAENNQIDWDKIPTKEMKDKLKEIKTTIDVCKKSIDQVDATSRIYKKISETALTPFSSTILLAKCISIFEKLGVDFSALDKPSEAEIEAFQKQFPDPAKVSKELSSKINKFVQEKQYISIEDNNRLLEEAKKKK
jgi:hypothetical protein